MLLDDLELKNCPETYAYNCKNYQTKCHTCMANGYSKILWYRPIDKSITDHPASIVQPKKKKRSYSRQGKSHERKIVLTDELIQGHYASGAIAGKGDAYMDLPQLPRIHIEIKTRFKNFNSRYTPTGAEIREGRNQGVSMWIISSKKPYEYDTVYMEYKLWSQILCNFLLQKDLISRNLKGGTIEWRFKGGIDQHIYQHYEKVRGLKPTNDIWTEQLGFNLAILDTRYGKFALTNNSSFSNFLHMYVRMLKDSD